MSGMWGGCEWDVEDDRSCLVHLLVVGRLTAPLLRAYALVHQTHAMPPHAMPPHGPLLLASAHPFSTHSFLPSRPSCPRTVQPTGPHLLAGQRPPRSSRSSHFPLHARTAPHRTRRLASPCLASPLKPARRPNSHRRRAYSPAARSAAQTRARRTRCRRRRRRCRARTCTTAY